MDSSKYIIRTFCGIGAGGNVHEVHLLDAELSENAMSDVSTAYSDHIHVFIFISSSGAIQNRTYFNGRSVRFCGSGTLAASKILFSLPDMLGQTRLSMLFTHQSVDVFRSSGMYAMEMKSNLSERPAPLAKWAPWLGSYAKHVLTATHIGNAEDYIVLELPDANAVRYAVPNFNAMRRNGGPALIVTAAASRNPKEDYVMRYFAPQYGNDEDVATGSANVYLMQYWHKRLNKKRLMGRQLSKVGGVFYGEIRGNTVTLKGRAERVK